MSGNVDISGQPNGTANGTANGEPAGKAAGEEATLLAGLASEQPEAEKPAEGNAPPVDAEKAEEGEKAPDPALAVPEKPEGYAFTFDEGVSVDDALLNDFKGLAHELGINQTQAQKLAGFYAHSIASSAQSQQVALAEMEKGWIEQIKSDPKYAENLTHATRAMEQFSTPELVGIFQESRLGSHPEMVNFMVKVGKSLAEPAFKTGEAGGEKSIAEILYPNQGK